MRRRSISATHSEPQQDRSRDTVRRIVSATVKLVSKKPFEQVSIAEIARAARISVGGFYARFPSKESLLDWFDQTILEEELSRLPENKVLERWKTWTLDQIVFDHLLRSARFLNKHRELLTRIALSLRSETTPESLDRAHQFNEQMHSPLVKTLLADSHTIRHPHPEKAVRFALMVVSAALREEVLFGNRRLYPVDLSQREFLGELTRLFLSYLYSDAQSWMPDASQA